jgi:hypothetical protein
VCFGPIELSGRLLVASDWLVKYATESEIARRAAGRLASDAVDDLITGLTAA